MVNVFVARTFEDAWMPYLDEYDVTEKGHTYSASADADFNFNVVASSNSFLKGALILTVWFEEAELSDNYSGFEYIPEQEFIYIHEDEEDNFQGWDDHYNYTNPEDLIIQLDTEDVPEEETHTHDDSSDHTHDEFHTHEEEEEEEMVMPSVDGLTELMMEEHQEEE
jgi:hypothetical protein